MLKRERRLASRMPVHGQNYINLDRDNGGIILNISEGGLCFQSTTPVQRAETIRFWFSYRRVDPDAGLAWQGETNSRGISRFIETGCELAWIDPAGKRGGLRFTGLSPDSREQIRDWMHQPARPSANSSLFPSFPALKRHANALQKERARLNLLLQRIQKRMLWNGFSGGVLAGIALSACVAGSVLLVSHRRELGDSLVEMGQRLGGRNGSQESSNGSVVSAAELTDTSSGPSTISSESQVPAAPPVSEQPHAPSSPSTSPVSKEKSPATLLTNAKLRDPAQQEPANIPAHSVFAFTSSDPPRVQSSLVQPAIPAIENATPVPGASMFGSIAPETEFVARPAVYIAPSAIESAILLPQKYLEIGKFKEKLLAERATEQLSRLGFATEVVPRNRLFGKSYQVLAGPYRDDREAESAHKTLASLGFTPRSYERGKRDLYLPPGLRIGATAVPAGATVISWESYVPDAIVKFEDDRGRGVTLEAKWVEQRSKYAHSAIAYRTNSNGSRTLLEIRFAGFSQALVFATARD